VELGALNFRIDVPSASNTPDKDLAACDLAAHSASAAKRMFAKRFALLALLAGKVDVSCVRQEGRKRKNIAE